MKKTLSNLVFIFVLFVGTPVFAQMQYQVVPNQVVHDATPPTVYLQPDAQLQSECTSCGFTTYRLVHQLNCGAIVAIEDVLTNKPTCKMVPRVSTGGAIELKWDTFDAVTVFIDQGVGHVSLDSGGRIVTPTEDTTYNMTVVSNDGLVGVCSARIDISSAKAEGTELLVLGNNNTQSQGGGMLQADTGLYQYNDSAVNHDSTKGNTANIVEVSTAREEAHTATMTANGPMVKSTSFFTSGLFLLFAFLFVFAIALWLIMRHGVR